MMVKKKEGSGGGGEITGKQEGRRPLRELRLKRAPGERGNLSEPGKLL
jgi:hypothetical protein